MLLENHKLKDKTCSEIIRTEEKPWAPLDQEKVLPGPKKKSYLNHGIQRKVPDMKSINIKSSSALILLDAISGIFPWAGQRKKYMCYLFAMDHHGRRPKSEEG